MIFELLNWDFRTLLQDYFAWGVGIAALLWGGGPERAVAISWLVLFELLPDGHDYFFAGEHFIGSIDVFYASVDLLAAAVWVTIAVYANRNYTLLIAAMQVLAVSAHLASGIAEPISPIGYAVMVIAPGWIQLLLLAIGLIRHRLRLHKFGAYRDWRISRPSGDPALDFSQFPLLGSVSSSWRDRVK